MNRFARLSLAAAGALFLFACADSSTAPATPDVTPDVTAAGTSALSHWNDGAGLGLVRCEDQRSGSDSEYIGPQGGRLRVGANQLIIPPGALTRVVKITAIVPDDDVALIRFEPHGLVFRRSPLLVLDADGCNIGRYTPDVVYISGGRILERIDARYYPQYDVVAAPIDHFSGYALAW